MIGVKLFWDTKSTVSKISISNIPCVAVRISYIGELGWEIYTPTEYGLSLWDELKETSREFNMICSGAGAFESLRLEKGYRSLGSVSYTHLTLPTILLV